MRFNKIYESIGKTPLIKLNAKDDIGDILMKVESFNPGGSIKDRASLYMIKDAEDKGILKEGGTIIEATSGNMGIGLAMIGGAKGYNVKIIMPDTMSKERIMMMKAYGAEVILTDGKLGMIGSVELAEKLAKKNGYFMPRQFDNMSNVKAHYETTGAEILEDTKGKVDAFVAGVGTGGTITGIGRRLKKVNPNIIIVAVEPKKSSLLSGGKAGSHGLQGIGANFIPKILDKNIIDKIITIGEEEAYLEARNLAKNEGLLCGISSGANVIAAKKMARELGKGKTIITVLPDTGERYLSTDLFNGE